MRSIKQCFSCFGGATEPEFYVENGKLRQRDSKRSEQSQRNPPKLAKLRTTYFANSNRTIDAGATCGVVHVVLEEATLPTPGDYVATMSIGSQSYLSSIEDATDNPKWSEGHHLVIQWKGPSSVNVSIHRHRKFKSRQLVGTCDVDLMSFFKSKRKDVEESTDGSWYDLKHPSNSAEIIGKAKLKIAASTLEMLEEQIWGKLMALVDFNNDGILQLDEFIMLIKSFRQDLTNEEELTELFHKADKDGSGTVDDTELAHIIVENRGKEVGNRLARCPVTGAELPDDQTTALVYLHLCLSDTQASLKGGFKTSHESQRSWLLKLSEWVTFQGVKYETGLNVGPQAAHILIMNRKNRQLKEEIINSQLLMAMYNIYQTNFGNLMLKAGAASVLQLMTDQQAEYMRSPESTAEIPKFLASFAGAVDASEIADPLDSFKTFNDFFVRKLKPSARPIADQDDETVLVSAADCRLMTFESIDDATKFWIKGNQFSVSKLLADDRLGTDLCKTFEQGCMAIFRLAPQDYHRFHFPVGGTLTSINDVPGVLYTVNPIAVNSSFANVLTENKRAVCMIESAAFGKVAFVVIGATVVGSINFTAKVGGTYKKGDEMGFFAYGGSTTVALFEKGKAVFDDDLINTSKDSTETLVKMGERIGVTAATD
ncbi:hypothetical protein BSKO_03653 [Bryopsis sp. KO-2023]|nr:hypothetical protein BSKO_03653 [Bryopsis sp. KO-2023]